MIRAVFMLKYAPFFRQKEALTEPRSRHRGGAVAQQRRPHPSGIVSILIAGMHLSCRADEMHGKERASTLSEQQNAMAVSRTELQQQLGFTVPEEARIVWRDQQQGIDSMIRVKLEMSRSTFNALAQEIPLLEQDLRPGAGRLGRDKGDWNPHSVPGIRSTQLSLPDARFMNVGVAEMNDVVTVFIMCHET